LEEGPGISAFDIASTLPSSKRSAIKVENALNRKPRTMRFNTRKMAVPLRILAKGLVYVHRQRQCERERWWIQGPFRVSWMSDDGCA